MRQGPMQPEKYDSSDLDALVDLEQSPGYVLVAQRVVEQLELRRRKLEQECDLPLTAYTRGYIAALRMVLEIPGILRAEIASQLKE